MSEGKILDFDKKREAPEADHDGPPSTPDVMTRLQAALDEQRPVVIVIQENDGATSRLTLDSAGVTVQHLAFVGAFLTKAALATSA